MSKGRPGLASAHLVGTRKYREYYLSNSSLRMTTVFYSWQSDLPNSTNRGFIEQALERAVRAIRTDDSLAVEPVVDRDTAGASGAPDIAATIFGKIDLAAVFVCDVSIINSGIEGRPTPNPNVLIELGYAKKALGTDRLVMVMNTATGGPEVLPFDLRMRRIVGYDLPVSTADRSAIKKTLESRLESELRTILAKYEEVRPEPPIPSSGDILVSIVEQGRPNQAAAGRQYMQGVAAELNRLKPASPSDQPDEELISSLASTLTLVAEFTRIVQALAAHKASDALRTIYQGFSGILEGYSTPSGFSGRYYEYLFDFHKFLGHELFVTLFAGLILEERWETITDLLDTDLIVPNGLDGGVGAVTFDDVSQFVTLLDHRNSRLELNRVSVHADLLNTRHTEGELAEAMPMHAFMAADYFLFLRSVLSTEELDHRKQWAPWSCLYLRDAPLFLIAAERTRIAERLLAPLSVPNIPTLRSRLRDRGLTFSAYFRRGHLGGLPRFEPAKIATR
ncbi:MAG: hypothetical protein ACR2MQ_10870 [Gemmatimonadaceae bacterium]